MTHMDTRPPPKRPLAMTSEPQASLTELVHRALDGDDRAWETLVDRLSGLVWKVIGSYRLSHADREDAFASTFYRLYDKLITVQNPEALPGWIATTARNEVRGLMRSQGRLLPMEELPLRDVDPVELDAALLDGELTAAVAKAFERLPAKGQALLRLLTAVPPLSYGEIGRILDLPHGSIGPMRLRYLQQVRTALHTTHGGE